MTSTVPATRTDVAVDATVRALAALSAHRRQERALLTEVRASYVTVWQTGVPKTGPNGVAALVQNEMRRRGWSDDDLHGLGTSAFNVRGILDHADDGSS